MPACREAGLRRRGVLRATAPGGDVLAAADPRPARAPQAAAGAGAPRPRAAARPAPRRRPRGRAGLRAGRPRTRRSTRGPAADVRVAGDDAADLLARAAAAPARPALLRPVLPRGGPDACWTRRTPPRPCPGSARRCWTPTAGSSAVRPAAGASSFRGRARWAPRRGRWPTRWSGSPACGTRGGWPAGGASGRTERMLAGLETRTPGAALSSAAACCRATSCWPSTRRTAAAVVFYNPARGHLDDGGRAMRSSAPARARQLGRPVVHRHASAMSSAYPGFMTLSMIASRSSNGRNADFIALIVNHRRSARP